MWEEYTREPISLRHKAGDGSPGCIISMRARLSSSNAGSLSRNFPSIQNSGNFSAGRLSLSAGGSDIGSVLRGLGGGGGGRHYVFETESH